MQPLKTWGELGVHTARDPAYFDVANEMVAELIAHFIRQKLQAEQNGDTQAAADAQTQRLHWRAQKQQLLSADDADVEAITHAAAAAIKQYLRGTELHQRAS